MGLVQSAERPGAQPSTASADQPSSPSLGENAVRSVEENDSVQDIGRDLAKRMSVSNALMERIIGGGFMLVIGIIMLGFLFDLDLVSNFSGPFADQLSTVETVLGAAIVFAVLGILALAGVYAYSMFQGAR